MRNCCTGNLYLKFSYDVRNILRADRFKDVFTEVELSIDKSNLNGWNTNQAKQVSYFGAGVGGTVIGYGASKVAITDDLYKSLEDALSERQNERIIQWKEATHDSRFEKGCSRVDIGTRWSINDVIGRQIDSKIYDKSIIVPALNENEESFCENVMSTEEYLQMKGRTRPEIWVAEYQQQPVDITGRLFGGLKLIANEEFEDFIANNTLEGAVAYIDVADQGADYTAMAIVGVIKNDFFVLDYVFSRDNTDITIPICAEKLNKWNVSYVRVETNAMGSMFARALQNLFKGKVLGVHNQTNKQTRIIMQSAFITNRFTFVQRETVEARLFLQNVTLYAKEGSNKNDDAPDCLSGLSIFVQSMFGNLI
jgi:predicted phage terminase large subunit-like protein